MKVWVTKYALSSGIIEHDVRIEGGYYWTDGNQPYGFSEAFQNKSSALQDAELRRVKKIASLREQIAKLESLRFDQ